MTSSTGSLLITAPMVSPSSMSMGTSFSEFTETSIALLLMAASSSLTKAPTTLILSRDDVRSMSPSDFMPTISRSPSYPALRMASTNISVCRMARALSLDPTFMPSAP